MPPSTPSLHQPLKEKRCLPKDSLGLTVDLSIAAWTPRRAGARALDKGAPLWATELDPVTVGTKLLRYHQGLWEQRGGGGHSLLAKTATQMSQSFLLQLKD